MDNRDEAREFLTSRRARITPEQVGFPAGSRRRVPGLRRAEVAALADVSVEYYAKLERGNLAGVSPGVLEAVARALRLDDVERAHLWNLARAQEGSDALTQLQPRPSGAQRKLPESLLWTLEAVTTAPAFVVNSRLDLLATNRLGRAFWVDLYNSHVQPPNIARYQFLDPASHRFYPDWDVIADRVVDVLRNEAGRNPHDKGLHDLVGELSTRSEAFRARWGMHNVTRHGTGSKRFHHPVVGDLALSWLGSTVDADPGLTLLFYAAEPGSPSEQSLRLLASWAASQDDGSVAPRTPSGGTAQTSDGN
ncbi:helix-turn-helix transcriptional regulator [Streptomyces sp. NPDC059897]|uniref:helix-turn-helix transcriptional regulator n=1 Tax=Streptomyces sp. NPDC059897 TaxID=3346994 RepID=UPI0036665E0A